VPPQTDAQLAEMTANYFGMISLVDHQIGRILDGLQELGLTNDTLIVFASDHGDMMGDHGLYLKGPMFYEGVLRVPLIIAGPDIPKDQLIETPVSTIDLASTFLESAGIASLNAQSTSLHPVIKDNALRECAWSEWKVHPSRLGVALDLRAVRTARYSYTYEMGSGAGELYDLLEDPQQMVNQFDSAQHASVREKLHALLMSRPGIIKSELSEPVGIA
jgi:arylsulfatase A-like enzyme